jgi:hypothetical protein
MRKQFLVFAAMVAFSVLGFSGATGAAGAVLFPLRWAAAVAGKSNAAEQRINICLVMKLEPSSLNKWHEKTASFGYD